MVFSPIAAEIKVVRTIFELSFKSNFRFEMDEIVVPTKFQHFAAQIE